MSTAAHVPVFFDEVLQQAREAEVELGRPLRWALDGTFGRGGHSRGLLQNHSQLKLVAFDQDRESIEFAQREFADFITAGRLELVHENFETLEAAKRFATEFDFILLDLGVSSPQLDQAVRGFSFYHDGPLDMRMDHRTELTAAGIVNEWPEEDLAALFASEGEAVSPHKVARAIATDRKLKPFSSTRQLAELIERVEGWKKKGHHPATLYFMALRLRVNRELDVIAAVLPKALRALAPGGRLAVITFHSLEDRIVKNLFRAAEDGLVLGRDFGENVRRKATKPSGQEVARNPRSRSAKLRVFRRYEAGETKPEKNKYAHLIGREKK